MAHKVLILAQGNARRWKTDQSESSGLFLGVPKHLITIEGETILQRARRLFTDAGCEVVVIGPQDERYGETVTLDNPFPTETEQDKLIATQPLWSVDNRTIIAWGDCFYTEAAVQTIVNHTSDDIHYFRRPGASNITGHKWDESFAVSFGPDQHQRVIECADKVVAAIRTKKIRKDHIRTHYAAHLGHANLDDVKALENTPFQTIIDDWTDDFDRPDEWARWIGRFYKSKINAVGCAAWRTHDIDREVSKQFVLKHFSDCGLPAFLGTADGELFNRSAARNAAVIQATKENPDWKVAFIFDTDTFVSSEQLWAACYLADLTGCLVIAFDRYLKVHRVSTPAILRGDLSSLSVSSSRNHHASGAIAVPRLLWEKTGGYDERFTSWGGEDRSFYHVCNTFTNRDHAYRIPGKAFHIYHPISPENNKALSVYKQMIDLGVRYKIAAGRYDQTGCLPMVGSGKVVPGDAEKIREILEEQGAPLQPGYKTLGRPCTDQDLQSDVICYQKIKTGKIVFVNKGDEDDVRLRESKEWRPYNVCDS